MVVNRLTYRLSWLFSLDNHHQGRSNQATQALSAYCLASGSAECTLSGRGESIGRLDLRADGRQSPSLADGGFATNNRLTARPASALTASYGENGRTRYAESTTAEIPPAATPAPEMLAR